MDEARAREQLAEIDKRQAAADEAAVSTSAAFAYPFLGTLLVFLAAADLPEPWKWWVQGITALAIVAFLIHYSTRKRAAVDKDRFNHAVGLPLIGFWVGALVFVVAVNFVVRAFDPTAPNTIVAAIYVVGCYFGMKTYDKAVKSRLAQSR